MAVKKPATAPEPTPDPVVPATAPEPATPTEVPSEPPIAETAAEPEAPAPETDQQSQPESPPAPPAEPEPLVPTGVSVVDLVARKVLVDQNPALHPEVKKALADVAPSDLGDALNDPKLVLLNQALLNLQAQLDKPAPTTPARAPVTPQPVPTVPAPPAATGAEKQTGRTLSQLTPADFSEFAKLF